MLGSTFPVEKIRIMKHFKEIRVAVLAIISLALLYFGFNYLKGVNIFHKTNSYVAVFDTMNGLVEQGPVYVKGYKVGIVDRIEYDFTREQPFTVYFSTNTNIKLPVGTTVALVADGLISGEALQLRIPAGEPTDVYAIGDTIPSAVEPGMIEGLSSALMTRLDPLLANLDSIISVLKNNLTDEQIAALLDNANGTLRNANGITGKLDRMMADEMPQLFDSIRLVVSDVHQITSDLREADLKATILKLDTTVNGVNTFVQSVNSTEGTVGMLLNDRDLYINLNNTVSSADSLLTDLKEHPKRYVHFSLFGKKDK